MMIQRAIWYGDGGGNGMLEIVAMCFLILPRCWVRSNGG